MKKAILYPGITGEMAKRGETQTDIGKLLGLHQTQICKRLQGKKEWTIGEIEILCEHYNKNYYELFKEVK